MIVFVALALFLFFVLLGWGSRQRVFQRGDWRIGAGFLGIAVLFTGLIFMVRAEYPVGVALIVAAAVMIGFARKPRSKRGKSARPPPHGQLTDTQARDILGVGPSAGPEEIKAAYHRLMRMVHPDAGGSGGLASQLNAARDALLKR
jgi:hypothetical protein